MKELLDFKRILKKRAKGVHKKQLGNILIIAGSKNMSGAGLLCARAALRAGVGVVTVAYPECLANVYRRSLPEVLNLILPQTKDGSLSFKAYNEIIKSAPDKDLVALGPGLTRNKETQKLIVKLVKNLDKPLVIDADGLNALADSKKIKQSLNGRHVLTILTPHEAEMARLTGLSVQEISQNRKSVAKKYARLWRAMIVLKGYHTIIAYQRGRAVINKTGGPHLATAGAGDVLTGMIATLVSQNLAKPFESTATAVYIHGLAGDLATKDLGERSVIASDVINYLPKAMLRAQGLTNS